MSDHETLFSVEELTKAATDIGLLTALVLIRVNGDAEAAIAMLAEFSMPVEGDEVLDAAAVSALAIRRALEMGVTPL